MEWKTAEPPLRQVPFAPAECGHEATPVNANLKSGPARAASSGTQVSGNCQGSLWGAGRGEGPGNQGLEVLQSWPRREEVTHHSTSILMDSRGLLTVHSLGIYAEFMHCRTQVLKVVTI